MRRMRCAVPKEETIFCNEDKNVKVCGIMCLNYLKILNLLQRLYCAEKFTTLNMKNMPFSFAFVKAK
jgi:hypothetical protein